MVECPSCRHANDEGAKFCQECGLALTGGSSGAHEQRRTVTVLFCDLTGSTALGESLDPERLRVVLARYFDEMKAIVERHGGTVEKFIGDAVMAVFGVPTVHEDDALRAVRASVEMRDALPELDLQGRIGVMTGEVVTGTEERLVTGDPVNIAARLEAAAEPGTVLIGQPTLDLVAGAVETEAIDPLTLKGKAEPVAAHLLLAVHDAPERSHDTPFVGRQGELAMLHGAWERVRGGRVCELVTIVGEAGVGKSRLVAELVAPLEATVVRGRCLPYGEGITYWPVVEVLKQLDLLPPDEAAALAIRSLLGESDAAASAEEIAWAFRKTLEHAAAHRPVVVVFDDIQWGEQAFHDLIEHVALLSAGAPILLLCMARPDLVERHPTWPVTLRLDPLPDDAVKRLIGGDADDDLHNRIARAAGGNPLFIGEMLAMAAATDGEVTVPPTLQALLAARLDQLEAPERSVLERGSIEGETFHRGAVQALAPDETQVTPRLAALVRKQLIRPDGALLPGEDAFRFRHLLLRDAAYDALPKSTRADLHQRFGAWLEEHGTELVELDELLGYHLEQACLYREELGLPTDAELAGAARRHLTLSGRRAVVRGDHGAAASLLQRASVFIPVGENDLMLEIDLFDSFFLAGRFDDALVRAGILGERADAAGDHVGELCGRIQASLIRTFLEPEKSFDELVPILDRALPAFEKARNELALYTGYYALGWDAINRARMDEALAAFDRAAAHAARAGLPHDWAAWRAGCCLFGSTPVLDVLAWLDENEPCDRQDHAFRLYRGFALAMLGRFDEAHAILTECRAQLAERGGGLPLALACGQVSAHVELLAGDPAAAAAFARQGCELLEERGEQAMLSTMAGDLARALSALDRFEEADTWASRAAELGGSHDVLTQVLCRQVKGRVLARQSEDEEAERLAREAVAISETTDMLFVQGDAYSDLGEVLVLSGKPGEATGALEQALDRYERKGNLVMAERTRERLAELQAAP